jgi:hypothetical protein
MTSTRLSLGDAKIKSWYDDWGMTVCGSGGKPHIVSIRELTSPGVEAASGRFSVLHVFDPFKTSAPSTKSGLRPLLRNPIAGMAA